MPQLTRRLDDFDHRDPAPADERFLLCVPDVRDELRVLDPATRAFAVYWICTVDLSLQSLKGDAVLDSKGLD
jgi:hypothetical protein